MASSSSGSQGSGNGGDTEGEPDEGGQGTAPDYSGSQKKIDAAKQDNAQADRERLAEESA